MCERFFPFLFFKEMEKGGDFFKEMKEQNIKTRICCKKRYFL